MPARISICVENRTGVTVMHLRGHLGIDAHRELKAVCERCLADPSISELRLDLAAIESSDMTAVGLLLILRERGNALQKRLSLTHCEPLAERGLGVDEVSRLFTVV